MIKAVFDTVVFVRSLLNPYSRAGQLVFQPASSYTLVLSPPLIQEILEVLARPEITRKLRSVAGMDLRQVLDVLAQAEIVEIDTDAIKTVSRDPKDDKFLATAHAGRAASLVTEDRDLLDLVTHDDVQIVDTALFLDILRRLQEPAS